MKTAIYARVSTEEQAKEGYSISAQKQKLKAFCISQGWQVEGLYVDEGISAKDMNRPQLQQMIKDIEDEKIECVLVYRLDRLTRSVLDLYKLLDIFDKHNCKFKSATEVYDTTTAMGRMFITIVAALAQWERENTGERIAFGFAEKARQGKYPLNFRPIGYDLDLKTSKLTINKAEAKTIRLIFDMYLQGYSANRLCRYLNENNIRTKAGNNWNDKPLMQILKNPLYYGAIRWNDEIIENAHEPIIAREIFDTVQETIKSRFNNEPRNLASRYIFSGKLKCLKCGNAMTGYYVNATLASGEKVKYPQYRCLKKKTGECKGSRSLSERQLEESFIDYLNKFDYSEALDRVDLESKKNIQLNDKVDAKSLERQLEKIEQRKKKWQYAWTDDAISYEDFKKRMEEAQKEEQQIKEELDSLINEDEESINHEEILSLVLDIKRNWNLLEISEKKNLVGQIVEKIHYKFDENGKTKVTSVDFI
ncbi:recombinase family protein [Metabacillus sp. B2-18]|uniref:recombinase family protein n=1 Tax=Metabacillus sp. B2-18 TaxID=2897333 RepID=UPI001E438107|nr:recombinase family protein [Metabacillus sp. B2-18]UGB31664.1 recombinase family protein [Metabacillus sp. B2-18]